MNDTQCERICANLINGNISDAKKQAKRVTATAIGSYLREIGWSDYRATCAAHYLKNPTPHNWQKYCDAA